MECLTYFTKLLKNHLLPSVKKRLIFAIAVALVVLSAVAVAILDSTLAPYALRVLEMVQIVGLLEMVPNGTFITTRYFKITLVLIGTLFVGAIVTSVHSAAGSVILGLSLVGMLIAYLLHFLGKKPKSLLDIMKVSSLFFLFPLPLWFFRPISLETKNVAILIGYTFFAFTFILYILKGERENVWYFGGKKETHS